MDILDSRQRPQLKRSNTSQGEGRAHVQPDDDGIIGEIEDNLLLHEPSLVNHDVEAETAIDQPSISSRRDKRKRESFQEERNYEQDLSSPTPPAVRKLRQCRGSAARSIMSLTRSTPPSKEELANIVILVERAIRLSINGTSKSLSRVKIKANTISEGLSDIAPVVWKPGYLVVGESCPHQSC